MTYLGTVPTEFVIPVTRGADREFALYRKDTDGNAQPWDAAVYIDVDIDKMAPTRVQADVTDDMAIVRLESALCDQVKNSTKWRIIMSISGNPTLETAVAVGTFERHDG